MIFGACYLLAGVVYGQDVQVPTNGDDSQVPMYGDGNSVGDSQVPHWRLPVRVTVSLNAGYDENAATTTESQGSVFTSAAVNLDYAFGTSRTKATLNASTGVTYYPEIDSNRYDPNVSLTLAVIHQVNLRLTLNAGLNFRYQAEPDFSGNLTLDRRAGNYFATDNSLSASYQWLPRFSTITSGSFSTIRYDTDSAGSAQDRFDYVFGESLRFLYLPVTTLVADYRIAFATYQEGDRDSHTQALLFGFDHTISARLQGTLRAGAEFRTSDNPIFQSNDGVSPHFEATLSYAVSGKTSLTWNASYGTQESYVENSAASETFRTGLQATYTITPRLRAVVSGNYQHNENQGAEFFPGFFVSFTEDVIDVSLGLNYSINSYLSATAGCSRTEIESDIAFRSYSRNRYYGGLVLTF